MFLFFFIIFVSGINEKIMYGKFIRSLYFTPQKEASTKKQEEQKPNVEKLNSNIRPRLTNLKFKFMDKFTELKDLLNFNKDD